MSCSRVAVCVALLFLVANRVPAAIVDHEMTFFLRGVQAPTILNGAIADPGRNTLTFGGVGLPIESLVLTGSFAVNVRIDETTHTPVSLRFSANPAPSITAVGTVNYFVPGLGYVHVGEQVEPIVNAPAGSPQFVATGNAGGTILPRISGFTSISPAGVFDADRQSLTVTSGEYISTGAVAAAFVIPADQLIDASAQPLIITSRFHDDFGTKGLLSVRPTATGYAGHLEMDLSETFGFLYVSASTVPEPSSGLLFAAISVGVSVSRRRRAA